MDEDQWMYDSRMSEEVGMNVENEEDADVEVEHVDCSDAFNTSLLFASRDEILQWVRSLAHDIGFVAVIMRSDTNTGVRGRASFLLIACERSGEYRPKKHNLVRTCTGSRKCGCPFKLRAKPVLGGEGWMVKLICGVHNHEMAKSFVGHPYAGRLIKDEKIVVADMMKSMVKPRNILLTLKEHNDNSYTIIKQIYNARQAYHSSIRESNTEMQQLMMLLDRDQYIHKHRLKDDNVVRDLFWSHPDAVKLTNSCLFMRVDALLGVIVTNRDFSLINAVKTIFPDATNLLCLFHIEKNVKAKCKTLVAQKNAWDYVMEAWGSLVDCPCESSFDEYLKNLEMACSLVESVHWSLKRLLQNSVGDICSVWEAMNNMMTLQHTQIKASFETSTHVVGHMFKVTLYKKLLGMVSRYALNEITAEYERVAYAGKNPSRCGYVMRSTHGLPCAYQGLCETQVIITEEMETISKRFEQLDVCGKVHLKSKLREIAYLDMNSMCPSPEKAKQWSTPYISRMQHYTNLSRLKTEFVDLGEP
ncbi:hypothetical protein GmHk_02G004768 [Glycine max]|nr:hypothetical protein GmHk_02G004768 [Glycine max]